jgi:ABC-type multidrug transport system permease subunit
MKLNGVKGIYYREFLVLYSRRWKVLMSSSVSPLLFLLAFGYGVGRFTDVDGVSYLAFLMPGLIAMSSMNQSYGISTEINISRFYFRVFDEYLLAPVQRWEIVAGEMLYGVTRGLIPVVIVYVYSLIIGVHLTLTPLFALSLILHLFIFSLMGLIVALMVTNHGDQFAVNTFVITPMVFLSGTFYPVDKMPLLVKWLAQVFPLTYSTELIRYSLLGGDADVWRNLGMLLLIFVALFAYAYRVVRGVEV